MGMSNANFCCVNGLVAFHYSQTNCDQLRAKLLAIHHYLDRRGERRCIPLSRKLCWKRRVYSLENEDMLYTSTLPEKYIWNEEYFPMIYHNCPDYWNMISQRNLVCVIFSVEDEKKPRPLSLYSSFAFTLPTLPFETSLVS